MESTTVDGKIAEITEPTVIQANGIHTLPALMIEGDLVSEGRVPDVAEIVRLLRNKGLFKSKLFQLRCISVPVDLSEVSANALVFAWKIAEKMHSKLEIVYAMDSIFEGSEPSPSGFLSSYTKTMQTELDAFIRETMKTIGVDYEPPVQLPGAPGEFAAPENVQPHIASKVIHGAPDIAISAYSRQTDLLVMGTTGRGGLGKKIFGSVSLEVSKIAHCPVLFVPRASEFRGFENVVYASDFESLNALSVQQAVSFTARFDGQIHFVHVGPGGEKNLETQIQHFESIFSAAGSGKPFLFRKMVSSDIVPALSEYSFYHRIDLLVFTTHQRDFWDNILHKSVTDEVLMNTERPILVIHSDDDMVV